MKLAAQKGQSALEYMMTYGWMLLVAGIVAVFVWQFIAPQPPPHGCSGFAQFSIPGHKVSSIDANVISLVVQNDAGAKLTLNSIVVSFYDDACTWTPPAPIELRAGETKSITIPKTDNCAGMPDLPEGEFYKAEMVFDYTLPASGINHLSAGECHGTVE